MKVLFKQKKEIVTEITRRIESTEGNSNLEKIIKQKSRFTFIASIILIAVISILLCSIITSSFKNSRDTNNKHKIAVCSSCDRSWEAGDTSKNYTNIAKTGMCKNCENNYHSMKQFLDK